jgi:hypothetical protein
MLASRLSKAHLWVLSSARVQLITTARRQASRRSFTAAKQFDVVDLSRRPSCASRIYRAPLQGKTDEVGQLATRRTYSRRRRSTASSRAWRPPEMTKGAEAPLINPLPLSFHRRRAIA